MLLVLVFLSSQTSIAQQWVEMMHDPNANFYETVESFNQFWEGKTIEKGKGYKQFRRWEAHMAPRVYPTGDVKLASQAFTNYRQWEADQLAAGIPKSTNGNWSLMGPVGKPTNGGAGRINFIRFDPTNTNTIWVGAPDGGLWKTTNGGTSWTTNTDQLTVIGCSDVAIDPSNTQVMYLATGDGDGQDSYSIGVLKSTDGGNTWNTTGLTWTVNQGRTISRILVNPNNPQIVMAFASNGTWRSTNGGTSWTQVSTAACKDAEFKPGDPNTVYAAGTAFRRSTDGGATWTTISTGLTGIGRLAIAVSPANPAYVYVLSSKNSDSGYLATIRSTNSGGTFASRSTTPNILGWDNGGDSGGQGWFDLAIAVSPTNAEEVMIGGINMWKSTNGGTNWTLNSHWYGGYSKPYVHADIHDIVYLPGSGTTIFSGNDGGIFKTTNGGSSWSDISANLAIAQQYRIGLSASNATLLISGHQDNGTNRMNGTTWAQVYGGDGMDCFIDRTNNNVMVGSYVYGEYYRSTNGGASFAGINTGIPAGNLWLSVIRQDPVTATTYYAGGRTALYRTTNSGTGWTALGTPTGSGSIIEFAIAPSNNQIIYALKTGTNGVSKSTNGGTSFTSVSTGLPTTVSPTYVAVSNTDPNVVFVTYSGYGATSKVFKSTNGGTSWTNISSGLPNIPVNCIVYHNNSTSDAIYIGTDVGVYYRDNTTAGWVEFSMGLPRTEVAELEIYYPTGRLRAATFGRGTWDSDLYSATPAPPTANFTGTPTAICQGQSVQFTSTSSGFPDTYSWSFPGGTPAISTAENPLVTYNTAGTYDVTLTVSNAFGNNTLTQTAYITVLTGNGDALPVTEGFVGTTFVPAGWSIVNPDGSTTWVRTTAAGNAPTTGNSMMFDNYNIDDSGNQDEVRTMRLDLSSTSANQLTFDVAYAPYDATYFDGLEVLVSSDCGATFTSVYNKSNTVLATAAATTNAFTPTSAQWRNESVSLSAYDGMTNVIIAFRNLAGYGNRIFVDNINISGTAAALLPVASFTPSATSVCAGETVTFTNTSTNATSSSWTFTGGTPGTSTATSPTVTYNTPGTYNVTLIATNSTGSDTETMTGLITVTAAPSAPGTITGTTSICANTSGITYSIAAVTGATSYTWSVPSGATITAGQGTTSITVSFGASSGNISVTANNACGTSSASSLAITINPVPSAPASISGLASVCASSTGVTYTIGSVAGASSYTWTVPAGASITSGQGSTSITVSFGSASGSIGVSANNSCGSSIVTSLPVTVNTVPSTPGSISGSTAVCPNSSGNSYSVSPVAGATTYNWTLPAGATISSGSGTNSIVVSLGSNAGNISVTASNSCGTSASSTITIALSGSAPSTPGLITGSSDVCAGSTVSYTIAAVNGATSYTWNVPAGSAVSTGQGTTSISVLFGATSGNITVNASSSCGTSPNSVKAINVNAAPSAPAVTVNDDCGQSTLTASGSNLLWSTGENGTSISVAVPGNYTVTQTINGCTSANAVAVASPVEIPSAPTVNVVDGCGLSIVSATGSNLVWSTGETSSSINVTTSGTVSVTQTVNGCTSPLAQATTSPFSIPTVTVAPIADVCIDDAPFTLTSGSPSGGVYSGPGVNNNIFDPSSAGFGTHMINYQYTDVNGCSNSNHTTVTVGCASTNELQNNEDVKIYPNPNNGNFAISGLKTEFYEVIEILDEMGRIVSRVDVSAVDMELKVVELASGHYTVRISGIEGTLIRKLQIIR